MKTLQSILNRLRKAQQDLDAFRSECLHPETEEAIWQARVGSQHRAIVCKRCGGLIKLIGGSETVPSTASGNVRCDRSECRTITLPKGKKIDISVDLYVNGVYAKRLTSAKGQRHKL